ncbi:hypothetical protein EV426DRAFT_133774 [Tirmania nivea]|nr:hypothetical protein EV426DRAFT_133774 [Tirmania nivea]
MRWQIHLYIIVKTSVLPVGYMPFQRTHNRPEPTIAITQSSAPIAMATKDNKHRHRHAILPGRGETRIWGQYLTVKVRRTGSSMWLLGLLSSKVYCTVAHRPHLIKQAKPTSSQIAPPATHTLFIQVSSEGQSSWLKAAPLQSLKQILGATVALLQKVFFQCTNTADSCWSRPREKIYAVALQNLFLATMLEIDRLEPHETSTHSNILVSKGAGA